MKKLSCGLVGLIFLISPCFAQTGIQELVEQNFKLAAAHARNMIAAMSPYPDRLPRTLDADGKLVTCNSSWWTSGFFPGILWLLYEHSRDTQFRDAARLFTARIEKEKSNTGTHDLGFMLNNSFGNGLRISKDDSYRDILLTGARSLAGRFSPRVGCILSWNPNARWRYPVIIDNMMNLEFLMWAAKTGGDSTFQTFAITHADTTIKNHFRKDFSTYHVVSYDPNTGEVEKRQTSQGFSDESAWARGQSWGLYGFVMMYRETGLKRFLDQAQGIAGFLLNHPNLPGDKIPYWDYNAPNIPNEKRDASAAAIMASALVELSWYAEPGMARQYIATAEQQVRSLSTASYLAQPGTNGNFILKHSVGSIPGNSEVDVPLTYTDYYFLEAMKRLEDKRTVLPKEPLTSVVKSILNEGAWEGKEVIIIGYYRGFDLLREVDQAPPVTRSDWVVKDQSGAIYVQAKNVPIQGQEKLGGGKELLPTQKESTSHIVRVTGVVRANKQKQFYIEPIRMELVK